MPIYCLSAPINMVKEAHGRESPAECSEPVEGGAALALRLRLSTGGPDRDLPVSSKNTIAHCKAKLHVSIPPLLPSYCHLSVSQYIASRKLCAWALYRRARP